MSPLAQQQFDEFWRHYPRKVGKLAAAREWERKRPDLDAVLAALAWQVPQWTDPAFIPHPRTWLCQGRWLDERTGIKAEPPRASGWYCRHDPPCTSRRMHQAAIEMGR